MMNFNSQRPKNVNMKNLTKPALLEHAEFLSNRTNILTKINDELIAEVKSLKENLKDSQIALANALGKKRVLQAKFDNMQTVYSKDLLFIIKYFLINILNRGKKKD